MSRPASQRASSDSTVTGARPWGAAVAVTGAASGLGAVLAERLVRGGCRVVGVDLVAGALPGVEWRQADVRDPGLASLLDDVDSVVHLAVATTPDTDPQQRRDLNVRGTQTVVTASAAAHVRHLVLVTSAAVFGASSDNPISLDDEAPLRAVPEGLVGDLLEIEGLAERSRELRPAMRVSVVRPATLVGAGADSLVTRHFSAPRLLALREVEMRWQFVHADDAAAAIDLVLQGGVPHDVVTVACEGWLTQADVEGVSGLRRLELPASMAFATAERLHRAGLTPTPSSELAFVVYPWVVSSARLRDAGWTPGYDNVTALGALLADLTGTALVGRRLGRADLGIAGAGAAGATVAAVLGTAAFVRRARRSRGM